MFTFVKQTSTMRDLGVLAAGSTWGALKYGAVRTDS
jgi:hypothetical protein